MRTMLDYDNLKLRERTFLDFTDDEAIIGEIIGDKEFLLRDRRKERKLTQKKLACSPIKRYMILPL